VPSKQVQWGWIGAGACTFIRAKKAQTAILVHYASLLHELGHNTAGGTRVRLETGDRLLEACVANRPTAE
jgi:hypothetical protein